MALIHCPECNKEISDKVISCPHCGYPLKETEMEENNLQQVSIASVNLKTSNKTKKIILISIISCVVIVIAFFGFNAYNKNKEQQEYLVRYNQYIDNLNSAQTLMIIGGADAEELCNLTYNVWSDAIYEEFDVETIAYTKPDGYFVSDFNEALANLFKDTATLTTIGNIEGNQDAVKLLIKDLQSPPEGLEKCFDTVTELYTSYKGLTNLAINPTGSLQSFSEQKAERVSSFMDEYDKLSNQIPDKKDE